MATLADDQNKPSVVHVEDGSHSHDGHDDDNDDDHDEKRATIDRVLKGHKHDAGLDALEGGRFDMTDEDSRRICRKIDWHLMPILVWVFFLQVLDKSCVGYAAAFDLKTATGMTAAQYSTLSSSGYWAQLALCCGPTAWLIVRLPTRKLLPFCVLCWAATMFGLAFSKRFAPILACRVLLGLFESISIPIFTVIVSTWYRRREQPLRIAMWSSMNGGASMLGSLLAWAVSFIPTTRLHYYQILFLTVALATLLTAPLLYWRLDNNPAEARFLAPDERKAAIERLRDNNTGVETKEVKWDQVLETLVSPAIGFYFLIAICTNSSTQIPSTFGPLLIKSFGFNARETLLLNIPFGFVQFTVCIGGCALAAKLQKKGYVYISFLVPAVMGSGLLYGLNRKETPSGRLVYGGPLLFGYYCLGFLNGCLPLFYSWLAANTGGYTKKSLAISICQAGAATGNIFSPLLFKTGAPEYHKGLGGMMGILVACIVLNAGLIALLAFLNKRKEKERVAHGKPAKIANSSMANQYRATQDGLGEQAFFDLTDHQNDEFVYTL